MADTLKKSVESIMSQIDDTYEVIIIDDGSSDGSVTIGSSLASEYPHLTFISLDRDPERRLGETRNMSIRAARGDWCIFHLDTDDLVGPHIKDFVSAVTEISKSIGREVLYSGQQIHMAKRKFLLHKGPFNNIYRGEDWDLYMRLVENSEWIVIKHKRFIHRLNRPKSKLLIKNIKDNFDQITNDLREDPSLITYWKNLKRQSSNLSHQIILFRILIYPFARRKAGSLGVKRNENYPTLAEFVLYRERNTKTFSDWITEIDGEIPSSIDKDIFF